MFFERISSLTPDDVRRLTAAGIPASRVSNWKHRKRLPTRPQTLVLCTVLDLNFDKVNRELTEIEATEDAKENSPMAALLKTLKGQWHFS